jgi:hypothetical protein
MKLLQAPKLQGGVSEGQRGVSKGQRGKAEGRDRGV